jgi:hypothetical protein
MPKTSEWRAVRNEQSLKRLERTLPNAFPAAVLTYARSRPLIPPTPRLAMDRYWRSHPLRADALARGLAVRSGAPTGWTWRLGELATGLAPSFRTPPAPFREKTFARGPGFCCICGQPVYKFGWHVDLWNKGPNRNAAWHGACVVAWQFWIAPATQVKVLKRRQRHRCAETGQRLWRTAEVDHRTPLFQVWCEQRDAPWPLLLGYWGTPNLQVINRDVHVAKCTDEAVLRAQRRRQSQDDRSTNNLSG